ncbi:MAG TPA: hypothetical protein VK645_00265 [Chitinophagaceae bacterium]|nr:hypothetical protein [Chitinophagaceae bacterium]
MKSLNPKWYKYEKDGFESIGPVKTTVRYYFKYEKKEKNTIFIRLQVVKKYTRTI